MNFYFAYAIAFSLLESLAFKNFKAISLNQTVFTFEWDQSKKKQLILVEMESQVACLLDVHISHYSLIEKKEFYNRLGFHIYSHCHDWGK